MPLWGHAGGEDDCVESVVDFIRNEGSITEQRLVTVGNFAGRTCELFGICT